MTKQILTANRLTDGHVVFLTSAGQWSPAITDSRIGNDEASCAEMVETGNEAVLNGRVVAPYLIEAMVASDRIEPKRLRERIRAGGPTAGSESRIKG